MLYVMFIIRGISLVDIKTAKYVTYRYRSNSIAFQNVFEVRIIWAKIRAKLITNITTFKKVFFFYQNLQGTRQKRSRRAIEKDMVSQKPDEVCYVCFFLSLKQKN